MFPQGCDPSVSLLLLPFVLLTEVPSAPLDSALVSHSVRYAGLPELLPARVLDRLLVRYSAMPSLPLELLFEEEREERPVLR